MKTEEKRFVAVRLPAETYEWIKTSANNERRTLTQQIVYVLERAIKLEEDRNKVE